MLKPLSLALSPKGRGDYWALTLALSPKGRGDYWASSLAGR
jgi:hypothetical protein